MKKKEFPRTKDCAHIIKALAVHDKTPAEFGAILGVAAKNTVSNWLKQGYAPKWTLLACEALHRRTRTEGSLNGKGLFIIELPEEHLAPLKTVLSGLGGTITEIKRG